METLLHVGLSNAVLATVLALVALGISRLGARPALRHGLWLLVLLKLVSPSIVAVSVPLPRIEQPAPVIPVEATPALDLPPSAESVEPSALEVSTPDEAALQPGLPEVAPTAAPFNRPKTLMSDPPETTYEPPTGSWQWALLGAWLVGSAGWLALAGWRITRFQCLLCCAVMAPQPVQRRTRELAARLGLRRAPVVWILPGPVPPMLWALVGSPRIIVPSALWGRLTEEQQNALLLHELAHLRRRDHWVRRIELLTLALYWWHPVAWLARRELHAAEEECCDAWVVWALPDNAVAYASALVEAVTFLSQPRPALPAVASGMGHFNRLNRRLTMIVQGTTPRALPRAGLLALVGLGLALLPWIPALAQDTAPKKKRGDLSKPSEPASADGYYLRPGVPVSNAAQTQAPSSDSIPSAGWRAHQQDAEDDLALLAVQVEIKAAEVQEVRAMLHGGKLKMSRARELVHKGLAESVQVDQAHSEIEVLEARLRAKEAHLKEAELRRRQAQRRVTQRTSVPTLNPSSTMPAPNQPATSLAPSPAGVSIPSSNGTSDGNSLPALAPTVQPGQGPAAMPRATGPPMPSPAARSTTPAGSSELALLLRKQEDRIAKLEDSMTMLLKELKVLLLQRQPGGGGTRPEGSAVADPAARP